MPFLNHPSRVRYKIVLGGKMEFWIITTAIAALVAGFLVFSLRAVKPASDMDEDELQFY